jgi:hypothetical protein
MPYLRRQGRSRLEKLAIGVSIAFFAAVVVGVLLFLAVVSAFYRDFPATGATAPNAVSSPPARNMPPPMRSTRPPQ